RRLFEKGVRRKAVAALPTARARRAQLQWAKERRLGGALYKSMFFTKRTQLKNVEVFWNKWVGGKSELGSFCKKRQKTGNKW
ncbi:MAG: hypothetical protein ABSH14_04965, partial [Verrucomicrobiia bacterium]